MSNKISTLLGFSFMVRQPDRDKLDGLVNADTVVV